MSFISTLGEIIDDYSTSNSSSNGTKPCDSSIDDTLFYSWMLLPSGLFTILLAFLIKRKNMYLNILGGRPGLLYPLNLFTLENRYTVASAYGSLSFVLVSIIVQRKPVIPFSGQLWLKIFQVFGSVLLYGLAYFPLFAGLASRSLIGYGVASLFAWIFAIMNLYKTFECDLDAGDRMLIILRNLPNLIACIFLSVSLTYLFAKRGKMMYYGEKYSDEIKDDAAVLRWIRGSHYGRHVRELFFLPSRPRPSTYESNQGFFEKAQNVIVPFTYKWIYHRQPNFRYPARIVAIITAIVIIIYQFTVELITISTIAADKALGATERKIKEIESLPVNEEVVQTKDFLKGLLLLVVILKGCFIAASCLSFLLGILMCLHTLSSYRKNVLALFKGDHKYIPSREGTSNVSMLMSTVRYTGYQIAYAINAYFVHWIVFFILSSLAAAIILLLSNGYAYVIGYLVTQFWPIPFNIILMLLIQKMVTKFMFCQDNGRTFGITNRRGFFIYSHFIFFYNIFMGCMSSLLRIFKGLVIGALMLGRLDQSTLPRKWQWFDPGFTAYFGFIHTENYLMNPTVNTFIALLRSRVCTANQFIGYIDVQNTLKRRDPIVREDMANVENRNDVVKKRARTRWYLAYTLYNNPHLRIKRKAYLVNSKAKQERANAEIDTERKVSERESKI